MWRYVVAAVLLLFAWKGSTIDLKWPPQPAVSVVVPQPPPEILAWVEPLRPVLPRMTQKDRAYLSSLYDAMTFVLARDAARQTPIITTTEEFIRFHVGTLRLAIDQRDVGKYDGLAQAIDRTIASAIGDDVRSLTGDDRTKLMAACSALSYAFKVNGE